MSFPGQALQRCWHLVDANNQTVGRLATQVAQILKGKHKPTFLPNKDMGDVVVIVNAEKVHFSGKKWDEKLYRWHTGYPGGLKERPAKLMLERNPSQILRKAILGMMKKNKLRHKFIEPRLKIYLGPHHPHTAQLPEHVDPLPKHPKKRGGGFHFGLKHYATPGTYQAGLPKTLLTVVDDHHDDNSMTIDDEDDDTNNLIEEVDMEGLTTDVQDDDKTLKSEK